MLAKKKSGSVIGAAITNDVSDKLATLQNIMNITISNKTWTTQNTYFDPALFIYTAGDDTVGTGAAYMDGEFLCNAETCDFIPVFTLKPSLTISGGTGVSGSGYVLSK